MAPPACAEALRALVRFYRTGEIEDRRAYDIAWVADRDSPVDTINGFIEVYLDARGCKGAWEAVVSYVNEGKTRQCQAIADAAQWFEDRMPWDPKYRKPIVTGVSARAIDVVVEAGDSAPMTPIGINLPNDQAIREAYGSKSVSLSNIFDAYNKSTPASLREEFSWSPDEAARAERWGDFAAELSTNLHEIIGHGSGLVEPERRRGSQQPPARAVLDARGDARRSGGPLLRRRSADGGARPGRGRRSPRHRARRVRRLRAQRASCSCAASAKAPPSRKTTCATARRSCTG